MTVSNVTGLEELFDMEEVDSNIIAIENCQSNKVFTAEYLKEVRIAQEQSGCRENLEKQLTRDFNGLRKPYGRLLKLNNEYLNAIDVRQIFDTGTCLRNNDTGVDDFPNGLQIRDGVIVDDENVEKFDGNHSAPFSGAKRNSAGLPLLPSVASQTAYLLDAKVRA